MEFFKEPCSPEDKPLFWFYALSALVLLACSFFLNPAAAWVTRGAVAIDLILAENRRSGWLG
jgi:hypothetical protein